MISGAFSVSSSERGVRKLAFISVFDVIGPNMIGPSSSHTAGANVIGYLSRQLAPGKISRVTFRLYGSFAKTYQGHGTDKALLGGLLGFRSDDERIVDSFQLAEKEGLTFEFIPDDTETEVHPNTADIFMECGNGKTMSVRGESLGGGKARICRINGVEVDFTGEYHAMLVVQNDRPGVLAHITHCLSESNVNIAFMRLFREEKGNTAYTFAESDDPIPDHVVPAVRLNRNVLDVMLIQAI